MGNVPEHLLCRRLIASGKTDQFGISPVDQQDADLASLRHRMAAMLRVS
jgi:hypothetical protein